MTTLHVSPAAAAKLRAAERAKISAIIDKRIAAWEEFESDYPEHPGLDVLLAELDYLRRAVNESTIKETEADSLSGI